MSILKLKEEIKTLSERQRYLRNQRKTVNRKGPKEMEPYNAWVEHQNNRFILSGMFAAYSILRNKEPDPNIYPWIDHYVDKIVEEYREEQIAA